MKKKKRENPRKKYFRHFVASSKRRFRSLIYLEKTARVSVPLFFRSTLPRVQNTETDFTVVVKIRIETDRVPARCLEVNHHWAVRIIRRKVHVEFETTVRVRRLSRPGYQHLAFSRFFMNHDENHTMTKK